MNKEDLELYHKYKVDPTKYRISADRTQFELMEDVLDKPAPEGMVGTALRSFANGAAPAVVGAGLGAVAAPFGATAGGATGTAIAGPVGTVPGAIVGGGAAALVASLVGGHVGAYAQDKLLDAYAPEFKRRHQEQMAANAAENPWSAKLGSAATMFLGNKFGGLSTPKALAPLLSPGIMSELAKRKLKSAAANVSMDFGGQTAISAYNDPEGKIRADDVAINLASSLFGGASRKPINRLADKLTGGKFKDHFATQDQAGSEFIERTRAEQARALATEANGGLTPPVPESHETLKLQISAVLDPKSSSKAMLITPGNETYTDIPGNMGRVMTKHGTVVFNPKKGVTAEHARIAGAGPEFDGKFLGMATSSKPRDVADVDQVAIVTTQDGVEVMSQVSYKDAASVDAALAAAKERFPTGISKIDDNGQTIDARLLSGLRPPQEGELPLFNNPDGTPGYNAVDNAANTRMAAQAESTKQAVVDQQTRLAQQQADQAARAENDALVQANKEATDRQQALEFRTENSRLEAAQNAALIRRAQGHRDEQARVKAETDAARAQADAVETEKRRADYALAQQEAALANVPDRRSRPLRNIQAVGTDLANRGVLADKPDPRATQDQLEATPLQDDSLTAPLTEGEQIQADYDGVKYQPATPEPALDPLKLSMFNWFKKTAFGKYAAKMDVRNDMRGDRGQRVRGQVDVNKREITIDPNTALSDTPVHEIMHQYINDISTHGSDGEKRFINAALEKYGGPEGLMDNLGKKLSAEERFVQASGKDFISRLDPKNDRMLGQVLDFLKYKMGRATDKTMARIMSNLIARGRDSREMGIGHASDAPPVMNESGGVRYQGVDEQGGHEGEQRVRPNPWAGETRTFMTEFEKELRRNPTKPFNRQLPKDGRMDAKAILATLMDSNKTHPMERRLLLEQTGKIQDFLTVTPRPTPTELADAIKEFGPQLDTHVFKPGGETYPKRAEFEAAKHEYDTKYSGHKQAISDLFNGNSIVTPPPFLADGVDLFRKLKGLIVDVKQEQFDVMARTHPARAALEFLGKGKTILDGITVDEIEALYNARDMELKHKGPYQPPITTPVIYSRISPTDKPVTRHELAVRKSHPDDAPMRKSAGMHGLVDNTIGWNAVQVMDLPDGTKVGHVIENQMQWAQERREFEKGFKSHEDTSVIEKEGGPNGHPFLADAERLSLKAVIDDLRKQGITKIAISDGDTAMMTEMQDHGGYRKTYLGEEVADAVLAEMHREYEPALADYNSTGPNRTYDKPLDPKKLSIVAYPNGGGKDIPTWVIVELPPQAKGMRQHYDQKMANTLRDLTGMEGKLVNFGRHQNASREPIKGKITETGRPDTLQFQNPDGSFKRDVIARMYDLGAPSKRRETGEPFSVSGTRFQDVGTSEPSRRAQAAPPVQGQPPVQPTPTGGPDRTIDTPSNWMRSPIDGLISMGGPHAEVGAAARTWWHNVREYTGQFDSAVTPHLAKLSKADNDTLRTIMLTEDSTGVLHPNVPARLQPAYQAQRDATVAIRNEQNKLGMNVKRRDGSERAGKIAPGYVPNILDTEVSKTLRNQTGTPLHERLLNEFRVLNRSLGLSEESIQAKLDAFTGANPRRGGDEADTYTKALREAANSKLPPSWIEKDMKVLWSKYVDHAAKDLAQFKNFEINPKMKALVGFAAHGDVKSIAGHELVKRVLEDMDGPKGTTSRGVKMLSTGISGANALLTGNPITRGRDLIGTIFRGPSYLGPQHFPEYIAKTVKGLFDEPLKSGTRTGFNKPLGQHIQNLTGSAETVMAGTQKLIKLYSKATGSETIEKWSRIVAQAQGSAIIDIQTRMAKKGKASSIDFMDKLGTDWEALSATRGGREKLASRVGVLMQGSYDASNAPTWATSGPLRPFLGLARWGIEQQNNFKKFQWEPLVKHGDPGPMAMFLVAMASGGIAIDEFSEFANGLKGYIPTWKEIGNAPDKSKANIAMLHKLSGLGNAMGAFGFMGNILHGVIGGSRGQPGYDMGVPLVTMYNTILKRGTAAMKAMSDGEDMFDVMKQYTGDISSEWISSFRVLKNQYNRGGENVNKNARRNFNVFNSLGGGDIRQFAPIYDYGKQDEQRFDKASVDDAGPLLDKILYKAEQDPDSYADKLKSLRSIGAHGQGPSSAKGNRDKFDAYIDYVRNTQGQSAANKLEDSLIDMDYDRAEKRKMIPAR